MRSVLNLPLDPEILWFNMAITVQRFLRLQVLTRGCFVLCGIGWNFIHLETQLNGTFKMTQELRVVPPECPLWSFNSTSPFGQAFSQRCSLGSNKVYPNSKDRNYRYLMVHYQKLHNDISPALSWAKQVTGPIQIQGQRNRCFVSPQGGVIEFERKFNSLYLFFIFQFYQNVSSNNFGAK